MQKALQDLHISHERNESESIPILVEERGDAFRGIPKLIRLSLIEYLLGVPWESPSLSSCLSSFSSYRDLLDHRTLHPHKTSTENSVRSVSIIKQITTLTTVANQFEFCFEVITSLVLELAMNVYFGAWTCKIHQTGFITWHGRANTVQISFVYVCDADESHRHGMGLAVTDRVCGLGFFWRTL